MKPRSLAVLAAVTLVAVVVAYLSSRPGAAPAGLSPEALAAYPSFSERVNAVAEVEIAGHDDRFRVKKGPEGWGLSDRAGYPVDFEKVKDLVVRLAELEPLAVLSARPDNYPRMGVQDPALEGSPAKQVILRDADGATIADLFVGNTRYRGRTATVFVRFAGHPETWQCRGRLTFEADPMSWIQRDVVKLDAGKVRTLSIEQPDGETVKIARVGDTRTYEVLDVPAGKEPQFEGVANGPATALGYLRLDDVRPLAEVDFTAAPEVKATYVCDDGLVVTVEIARVEDKDWARLTASYDAAADAGAADAAEGAAADPPHAQVEARALQRTFDRWAYQLPEFKVQSIDKTAGDLLTDVAPPETPEDPAAPETTDEPADAGE